MAQLFANNVASVTVGSITANATTLKVAQGNSFPSPAGGDYFLATLVGLDNNGNENAWEIVKVTARSSNTLTIVRAQENTMAKTWPDSTRIEIRLTAGILSEILTELEALPSKIVDELPPQTGNAGKVLKTNGTQAAWAGGAGSGVDADTLDGQHASAFAVASHTHAEYAAASHTHTGFAASSHTHTSGINADTLGWVGPGYFAVAGHTHAYVPTDSYGLLGAFLLLKVGAGAIVSIGSYYTKNTSVPVPAGTWRCCGYQGEVSALPLALFQRVA